MTCNNIIIRLFQLLTSALLMSTSTAAEARISWRSLLETSIARSRKVRGGNYVSLATVEGHSGKPRCRTVVNERLLRRQEIKADKRRYA